MVTIKIAINVEHYGNSKDAHEMLDLTYDNLKGFILVCFLIQKPRVLLLSTKCMHYSTVNLTIE